jgi:oleate hydratase
MNSDRRGFIVGGGIGGLAAAAFMIRDGHMAGDQITIFEALASPGGSLDAGGTSKSGYVLRGSRMMTTENFECTWGLFKSIPSLSTPDKSVAEETIDHSKTVRWDAKARLVDRNRAIVDVSSNGSLVRN